MNSPAPAITVYVANHNYGQFLAQAIESVLAQTRQDFELIVIDDGSIDNSRQVIEGFAKAGSVSPVYQERKGLLVTNNIALRAARGRYIMRLDADDYLDKNALSVLAGVLDEDSDVGLVFPDYYMVDEHGSIIEQVRRHDFSQVKLLDQPAHGACTMIRRDCLLALGGYDETFDRQDGYELWTKFIHRFKVQNVNLPLFYYRQHAESLSTDEVQLLGTRAKITEKQAAKMGSQLGAIAVVPVRGQAADPSSPALRPLAGRPLIDWTLDAALSASRIQSVVVTSPDDEVLNHVRLAYAKRAHAVKRDLKMALPNTYIEETIFHALVEVAKSESLPEAIALLYIESPFRTAQQIDTAIATMQLFETDSVVAVRSESDEFYQHNGSGLKSLRTTRQLRLERDELYRAVGQLQVVKRAFLEQHRQVLGGRIGHIVLDQRAALRLRTQLDWQLAEVMARSYVP